MTGRGAEEYTFKAILKAIKAYFKAVFKTEQIYEHVVSTLKIPVNLTIIINNTTNISI